MTPMNTLDPNNMSQVYKKASGSKRSLLQGHDTTSTFNKSNVKPFHTIENNRNLPTKGTRNDNEKMEVIVNVDSSIKMFPNLINHSTTNTLQPLKIDSSEVRMTAYNSLNIKGS